MNICNTMELYVKTFKMKTLIVILYAIYFSKDHWGLKQKKKNCCLNSENFCVFASETLFSNI